MNHILYSWKKGRDVQVSPVQYGHEEIIMVPPDKAEFHVIGIPVYEVYYVSPFLWEIPGKFLLEVPIYDQRLRFIPFNYAVYESFDMAQLEPWEKEAMKIHLLLKTEMQIWYNNCRDISEVDAVEVRNEYIPGNLYILQPVLNALHEIKTLQIWS